MTLDTTEYEYPMIDDIIYLLNESKKKEGEDRWRMIRRVGLMVEAAEVYERTKIEMAKDDRK